MQVGVIPSKRKEVLMKVLFVNPVMFSSETKKVQRRNNIEDTMAFGLCKAFEENGYDITLYTCSSYEPLDKLTYPFKIIFEKPTFPFLFHPTIIPRLPKLKGFLKKSKFDLIICSEAFSLATYTCVKQCPEKTIVWQEMASYQHTLYQLPAKYWYNFIVKDKYKNVKIVARSQKAKEFISQFSNNVSDIIIDHGVDLNQFTASREKQKQFIVVSQLVSRKRVNKTIDNFLEFCKKYDSSYQLIIVGEGESRKDLEKQAKDSTFSNRIHFKGFLSHNQMMDDLSHSMAMLVSTERDENMITIDESLACCTPIITTSVPFTSSYIKEKELGYVDDNWSAKTLEECIHNNHMLVNNCFIERYKQGYSYKIKQFLEAFRQ